MQGSTSRHWLPWAPEELTVLGNPGLSVPTWLKKGMLYWLSGLGGPLTFASGVSGQQGRALLGVEAACCPGSAHPEGLAAGQVEVTASSADPEPARQGVGRKRCQGLVELHQAQARLGHELAGVPGGRDPSVPQGWLSTGLGIQRLALTLSGCCYV